MKIRIRPKSLFGRSILLLVVPMVLLQLIAAFAFYQRHWDTISRRLSGGIAGEISAVLELYTTAPTPADQQAVFDLAQCEIADPRLMQAWRAVRPTLETAPRGMERLVLRIDTAGDVHALVLAPGGAPWPEGEQVALGLAAADPAVLLWHDDGSGPVRLDGQPALGPRPTTFEQVAPAMGQRVRAWAAGALQPTAGEHAWDLYAGTGATSRLLREAGMGEDRAG